MSDDPKPKDPPARRPYQKPEVTRVQLDSEVLLASGCKTTSGSAKGAKTCHKTGACTNSAAGS